jgi:hypothetical protein
MSDNFVKRLRYYKGQLLTAPDFEDQQRYHIDKLRRHIQRFPFGVVEGLEVDFLIEDSHVPPFKISPGKAVDKEGNEIVVAQEIIVEDFNEEDESPFLSIAFDDTETEYASHSVCEDNRKDNRVIEKGVHSWDKIPNEGLKLTLAQIYRDLKGILQIGQGTVTQRDTIPLRIDAKIIPENQVRFNEEGHDHSGGENGNPISDTGLENDAVISSKILNGAVISSKIHNGAVTEEKIAPNQVVKSINDLKDEVTLAEGDNITIVANDNTLTIKAAADGHSLDTADGSEENVVYVNNDGNVGVGKTDPASTPIDGKLDVEGKVKMTDFQLSKNPEDGFVLTSDADGNGTWQEAAGDITGVTAGTGLTGGGTSGNVTLDIATSILNQLIPTGVNHNHTGGNNGPVLNHSDLDLGTETNPHHTTAVNIDTEGGIDQIVAQINASTGVINKERIEPFIGAAGWVRLPFLPKKSGTASEFTHAVTHSTSSNTGASGVLEIPVPPGATKIKNLRIAGMNNVGQITILLWKGGWDLISNTNSWILLLNQTLVGTSNPFNEIFGLAQTLNSEADTLGLYVSASAVSDIELVTVEFE